MASTIRNSKQKKKVGKKVIVRGTDTAINAAKRIVWKDVYIPKKLRKKIEVHITKNGNVVIRKKKK